MQKETVEVIGIMKYRAHNTREMKEENEVET